MGARSRTTYLLNMPDERGLLPEAHALRFENIPLLFYFPFLDLWAKLETGFRFSPMPLTWGYYPTITLYCNFTAA